MTAPEQREPGPVRLVLTMGVFGMLSGVAIAGAYLLTLPRIHRNEAAALERAVFKVLPEATRRVVMVPEGGHLVALPEKPGLPPDDAVFAGYDGHHLVGYAVPAQGPGFQDTIKLIYGFDPRRKRIIGLQILESRETPGLGDRIQSDKAFTSSFEDLAVEPKVVGTKKGRNKPNEVDVISGATISSTAVIRIINKANKRWFPLLTAPAPGGSR